MDHRLRAQSAAEAALVAQACERLAVPHSTLTLDWDRPETAVQERARKQRYRALAGWARERGLCAVATAHHADDQAETLVMRLGRGAGVGGLAAMRPISTVPGSSIPLLRPLLSWRRSELQQVCDRAGVEAVDDPSNGDEQFERVRVRRALAGADWLDIDALGRSAANLADADAALEWAVDREWERQVTSSDADIVYRPGAPREVARRIAARAVRALATEGNENSLRGRELDRIVAVLSNGGTATLRGVLCAGGAAWRFSRAPSRQGRR